MATREDVIAELQRKGYKGPIPEQKTQPQQQPQGQDINALIQSLTKAQQPTLTQNVGDAITRLGGGTPAKRETTSLGDVANLMKIQQMQNPGEAPAGYKLWNGKLVKDMENIPERPVDAARREKLEREAAILDGLEVGNGGGVSGGGNYPPGTTLRAGPLTIPVNREYTEGESTKLSNAESMGGQIQKLRELVQKDQSKQTGRVPIQAEAMLPMQAGKPDAQRFALIKNDLVDRLVRMRSGAQINNQEFARLSKLLPSIFRDDAVDLEQLAVFEQEMNAIEGRISQGAAYNPNGQQQVNQDPGGFLS